MSEDYRDGDSGSETISADSGAEPSWMLDEGTPGVGDRPDWLPDKFKTAADLGKSYRELEKMKASTAPDEYDTSSAKYLDPDFEAFTNLQKVAKDNRVSQDVMNEFVNTVDSYLDQYQVDSTAEMEKLGPESKERIEVLENWVENNLDADNAKAIFGEIKTAEGIQALEVLRNKMMENQSTVPSGNDTATDSAESLEDIQKELSNNLDKYKTDTKYQREMQGKLSRFAQNSDYIDKSGT